MEHNEKPKILFPYDFTAESDLAIDYLVKLAAMFNYSVEVLNIFDPGTKKFMNANKLNKEGLIKKVEELSDELEKKYNIPSTYLVKNVPIQRMRKISEQEQVSFIFLAINEPQKIASKIMKVVTTSPVPAYVVQHGVKIKTFENIIFPIDESLTSRQKAGWALRIAKKTKAKVHIFSINPAALDSKEKEYRQFKVIETVEDFFARNGISYVTEVAQGNYNDYDNDILNYGAKIHADLYIIMIPKRIFRSISQIDFKIIFNPSKVPVFCVNQRDLFVGGGFN